jgi:hypothetical protein
MISNPRKKFNDSFSTEKYQELLQQIENDYPKQLDFRIAETPIFCDRDFKIKLLTACNDIIDVIKKPDFKAKTEASIPKSQYVPNDGEHPNFLAIDFSVTKDENGEVSPQLIEIQGFPSLFGYQWYLGEKYREMFDIADGLSPFFNRLTADTYVEEMRAFLLGDEDPENVILLELYPEEQKTRLDFAITKKLFGVEPVCLTKVKQNGREVYYEKDGRKIPIKRIYNRVIFDDLKRNFPDLQTEFDYTQEIDAQWITNPNWFFRVSKFTMPLFKSKYVPSCNYVSNLKEIPDDLENYVLKPLYSFAGSGVKINVTKKDITEIKDPENFILQQKVNYEPIVEDIDGKLIKAEIRMLYIWPDGEVRPKLMTNLSRLSRGEMIGVDYNKNFDWVGGSCAFFEEK